MRGTRWAVRCKRVLLFDREDGEKAFQEAVLVVNNGKFERVLLGEEMEADWVKQLKVVLLGDEDCIVPGLVDVGFHCLTTKASATLVDEVEMGTMAACAGGVTTLIDTPTEALPGALALLHASNREKRYRSCALSCNVGIVSRIDFGSNSSLDAEMIKQLSQHGNLGLVSHFEVFGVKKKLLQSLLSTMTVANSSLIVEVSKVARKIVPSFTIIEREILSPEVQVLDLENNSSGSDNDEDGDLCDEIMYTMGQNETPVVTSHLDQDNKLLDDQLTNDLIELRRKYLNETLKSSFNANSLPDDDVEVDDDIARVKAAATTKTAGFEQTNNENDDDDIEHIRNSRLFDDTQSLLSNKTAFSVTPAPRPRSIRSCGVVGHSSSASSISGRQRSPSSGSISSLRSLRRQRRSSSFSMRNWRLDRDEMCSTESSVISSIPNRRKSRSLELFSDDDEDDISSGLSEFGGEDLHHQQQLPQNHQNAKQRQQPQNTRTVATTPSTASTSANERSPGVFSRRRDLSPCRSVDSGPNVTASSFVSSPGSPFRKLNGKMSPHSAGTGNTTPLKMTSFLSPNQKGFGKNLTTNENIIRNVTLRNTKLHNASSVNASVPGGTGPGGGNGGPTNELGLFYLSNNHPVKPTRLQHRQRLDSDSNLLQLQNENIDSSNVDTAVVTANSAQTVVKSNPRIYSEESLVKLVNAIKNGMDQRRISQGKVHVVLGGSTDELVHAQASILEKSCSKQISSTCRRFAPIEKTLESAFTYARNTNQRFEQVIYQMTATPAKALGIHQRKGFIKPGFDADFVILSLPNKQATTNATSSCTVKTTYCNGVCVYHVGGDGIPTSNINRKPGVFLSV